MKRAILVLLGVILGVLALCSAVHGEADFGNDEIMNALPDEARDYFDENGITAENGEIRSLTPGEVFGKVWEYVCESAEKPLRMLLCLIGTIFLCSVINVLRDSSGDSRLTETFQLVGVLAGAGIIGGYLGSVIETAGAAINSLAAFLLSYVPAFAGVMAVNGQAGAAASYNSVIIVASELFSQLTASLLFPAVSCILGISTASVINSDLHISSLAEAAKKLVAWALGLMMTVFVGLLSVQSLVASAADSVTLRTAKFTVSNSVPIIGGAVSDALAAVTGSISLIKGSMGGFGIIAAAVIILPALLTTVCFRLSLTISAAAGRLFGADKLAALLKCGENALDMIIAMLVSFALLTVISTGLMLALGGS